MSRMVSMLKNSDFTEDFGKLIRDQKLQDSTDQEKELGTFRSGSAPPSMEGALTSVCNDNGGKGDILSEDELKADAAYADLYFSKSNLSPGLPPPFMSMKDWRFSRRLQGGSANTDMSIFSSQPKFGGEEEDNNGGKKWKGEGLIGLHRQTSISEIIQDNMNHGSTIRRQSSYPASHCAFHDDTETAKPQYANLHHDLASADSLLIGSTTTQGTPPFQNVGSPIYRTTSSAFSSQTLRSSTPDHQLPAQIRSNHNPLVGGGWTSCIEELLPSFPGLNLSTNSADGGNHFRLRTQHGIGNHDLSNRDQNLCLTELECDPLFAPSVKGLNVSRGTGVEMGPKSSFLAHGQAEFCKSSNCQHGPFRPAPNRVGSPWNLPVNKLNSPVANFSLNGYEMNPSSPPTMGRLPENGSFPPLFQGIAPASAFGGSRLGAEGLAGAVWTDLVASAAEFYSLNELRKHETVNATHASFLDPLYLDHLKSNDVASAKFAALNNPRFDKDYGCNNSYMDFLGVQRDYLEAVFACKKSQYGAPYAAKLNCMGCKHGGNHALDCDRSYPRSPLASPVFPNSPIGLGSPMRDRDWEMHLSSTLRKYGLANGVWHSDTTFNMEERFGFSLLDELKSNKMKYLELSEIAGHVVKFSADQYGSRFIQQKLETATTEEKNMVFNEIMPHALALMTDVFGNYVIQKFLEHGSGAQIRELADKLIGHVLALSLHMYGCRVIQKAIEVVELDQKTSMVKELDGHVMRCVRDQNGNHVIQKCIECVPEDSVQFIVLTFYDQVVTLSTHPYGCRVIQRILEHCHDPKTQQIVMDEILQSVCMLAQDQYGNYVVQHVLEHGKPEERSVIIKKFTGQIVKMSQQKFASNVIEKCLTYGAATECQTLVDEMLGSTDENEPLQVMMKDQFANYVVQKVLETCDDQQLELILNRIKVHLNVLKKYTYGKHIVARVEKLVAAGEKRISSILAAQPALMA